MSWVWFVSLARGQEIQYQDAPDYGFSSDASALMEAKKMDARLALATGEPDRVREIYADLSGWDPPRSVRAADRDHDKVADWIDLCPDVPARKTDYGCPAPGAMILAVTSSRGRDLSIARLAVLGAEREALALQTSDDFEEGPAFRDPVVTLRQGQSPFDADDPILAILRGRFPLEQATKHDRDGDGQSDDVDACPDSRGFWAEKLTSVGCPYDPSSPALADFDDDPPSAPPAPPVVAQGGPKAAPKAPSAPAVAQVPVVRYEVAPAPAPLPSVDTRLLSGKKANNDAAVVVGLEDYFAIPDVPYAKRDAEAFYNFLVYTRGVPQDHIQSLTSGSNEHIAAAVTRAGKEVGPGGTVWVYFAGHGAANPKSGERMLLGDDVRSDAVGFASRGIEVGEIERLASANGGTPMLVLDTCYSGVGRSGGTLIAGTRFAVPQLDRQKTVAGMEWNAASADQVSGPLDPVQHGAFTYFAIGALRGWADGELDGKRDGKVTGTEAQAYVRRALRAHQKNDQQPVWIGPVDPVLSEGSEKGPDF